MSRIRHPKFCPESHGFLAITNKQILTPSSTREILAAQLNESQLKDLNGPSIAVNGAVIQPGIEKQWGLSCLLNPKGAPTGRGNGAATWAGNVES